MLGKIGNAAAKSEVSVVHASPVNILPLISCDTFFAQTLELVVKAFAPHTPQLKLSLIHILGKKTEYPQDYAPEVLEAFNNKHPEMDYWVRFKRCIRDSHSTA